MPSRTLRTALHFTTLMSLVAAPLALGFSAPASAAPSTGLVITEVYGGSGSATNLYNRDYVEIYNPTDTPIDLTGKSVQYRSGTGTGAPSVVAALSGSLPAKTYYLVGGATGANGSALPVAVDASGTTDIAGSSGTVLIANQATALTAAELPVGNTVTSNPAKVIDLFGFGSSNTFEGAVRAGAPTATTSAHRIQADTDNNLNDFAGSSAAMPPSPTNKAASSAPLAATSPGNKTAYANRAMTPFTLTASGGQTPYSWAISGAPAGVTASAAGQVSGTATETGTFTVTATVTDGASATATTQFTLSVTEIVPDPFHSIPEIQGTGASSPLLEDGQNPNVSTAGVVTATFPDGGLNGFVIQTPGYDPANDATPNASDGLFVYQGGSPTYTPPAVGDYVTIDSGKVTEFAGLTELTVTNGAFVTATAATPAQAVTPGTVVPGTACTLDEDTTDCLTGAARAAEREQHESELFLPTAPYTVT
ncbi:MAG TPA: lamin tail domain-containing protein, partial [Nocardioides sp.]